MLSIEICLKFLFDDWIRISFADGLSAEEEARQILRRSLVGEARAMSLIEFIRTMPEVGDGLIFRRPKRKLRK